MINKRIAFVIWTLLLSSLLLAKTYQIPDQLKKEVHIKETHLRASPNSQEAKFELAMAYAYTGQVEKGWTQLSNIKASYADMVVKKYLILQQNEPKQWKHPFKLAFGYYFKQEKKKAIQSFLRVLEISPDQVWAMGFLALIKGEEKKYDESVSWCNKALAIEPNATAIHFLLAESFRQKKKYFHAMMEMMIVGRLKTEERIESTDRVWTK